MSMPAIVIRNLHKSYGPVQAVRGVDLTVEEGEVFALLGPNGAGKTTIVEILEGHRSRDEGEVVVLGFDPAAEHRSFKERIGIVLQDVGVERFLTVSEVVEMYRGYYPHPLPLDDVIELVGLREKRNERVSRLSGGQRRRLDVAVGLAGDPHLLFLDEPTTGFDPAARRAAWEMIEGLHSLGKTILLTTHYMDEAQRLADRVGIIADGHLVAVGRPEDLMSKDAEQVRIRFTLPPDAPPLPAEVGALAVEADGTVTIQIPDPAQVLHDLTGWALRSKVHLQNLSVTRPNLEDIYLELTGRSSE